MARLLFAMALPVVALGVPAAAEVPEANGLTLLIAGSGMVALAVWQGREGRTTRP